MLITLSTSPTFVRQARHRRRARRLEIECPRCIMPGGTAAKSPYRRPRAGRGRRSSRVGVWRVLVPTVRVTRRRSPPSASGLPLRSQLDHDLPCQHTYDCHSDHLGTRPLRVVAARGQDAHHDRACTDQHHRGPSCGDVPVRVYNNTVIKNLASVDWVDAQDTYPPRAPYNLVFKFNRQLPAGRIPQSTAVLVAPSRQQIATAACQSVRHLSLCYRGSPGIAFRQSRRIVIHTEDFQARSS